MTSPSAKVTVARGPGSGSAVLSGTTTVDTVLGVADFANLALNAPGTYTLPGGQLFTDGRTGPAELLGPRDYTLTSGKTFFMIFDAEVINSNIGLLPKGFKTKFMFTFDFDPNDPDSYGNRQRYVANWADFFGTGKFSPFLNEGVLMTNVRLRN